MKVLVTGGTGVIGRAAITELLDRGHQVRLLSRGADDAADSWPHAVEPYAGDVSDADGLRSAADGCDAVLHIVGIVEESPPEVTFERVNIGGTRNMVAEAIRAGVPRFVYVSSLGADRGESDYHRSKLAAEAIVSESQLDWVIARSGNVFGPGDDAISLVLRMVRTLPAVPVIEHGDQEFQPIWHEDLAWALAECIERPDIEPRVLDIAGPELITVDELIDEFARITDRDPVRIPVPSGLAKLATKLASSIGLNTGFTPATIKMLLEGNVVPAGSRNGLTDVLGHVAEPIRSRLIELADEMPEQMPDEGVGPLKRRRFRAMIHDSRHSAPELFDMMCDRLDDFVPFDAEAEPRTGSHLEVGTTLNIELPPRGHAQVRVEEMADGILTLGTVEGHPLAGIVRFRLDEPGDGAVRFTIDIAERPATEVDRLAMNLGGSAAQKRTWIETAEAVIAASGGSAPDGVEEEDWNVDDDDAERIEDWVRDRVHHRMRTEERE